MKRVMSLLLLAALALLCVGCGGVNLNLPGEAGDILKQAGDTVKDAEGVVKEMKELLRDSGAEDLLDEIKDLARSSADLSDEELAQAMQRLAAGKGFALRESSMPQLIHLVRILEKGISLSDRVENTKEKVGDAVDSVRDLFGKK